MRPCVKQVHGNVLIVERFVPPALSVRRIHVPINDARNKNVSRKEKRLNLTANISVFHQVEDVWNIQILRFRNMTVTATSYMLLVMSMVNDLTRVRG